MPIENCKLSPTEAIADGVGVLVDDGTGCGKTLLGPAGYYLRVNGAGDGLEWVQAHEPVHFETGDEPFAWDDALQCGVIPLPGRLVDNGDGTFTFDPGNGRAPTTLRYGWTESTVMGSVVTFAYPDGTILDVDVCALIAQNCDATLADNGNGTYTHTSNSGVQTTFRGGWTEASVTGRAITFAYPDGTTLDVDLCALVAANCDVSLVENGDGTWTHRSIGGVQTRFPGGWTTVVDNGDSTLTVTTPDGAVQTIDVCALVAAHCDATLVENGDGTLTHTSNSGVQTTFSEGAGATHPAATLTNDDASFAWDDATQTGNIPVTTLTENVDGTVVINPGNGDPDVTIHAPVMLTNDDAPFAWNDATQTGNIPVTSITDNGDNTITVNPGNGAPSVTFCDGIVLNRPDDPTDEQLTRYDAAACTLTIPNALWGFKGRDFGAANIALPDGVFVNVTDLTGVVTQGTTADTDMSPVGNTDSLVLPMAGRWTISGDFTVLSDGTPGVTVTIALTRNGANWVWETYPIGPLNTIVPEITFINPFLPAGDQWGLAIRVDGTNGAQLSTSFVQALFHRI